MKRQALRIMILGLFTCERLGGWGHAFNWVRACWFFHWLPVEKPKYTLAA